MRARNETSRNSLARAMAIAVSAARDITRCPKPAVAIDERGGGGRVATLVKVPLVVLSDALPDVV
jgi:hypothetical protein